MPESASILLPRMLYLGACWLVVVTVHFVLCGWLAWMMSAPPQLPEFLRALDPLMGRYGYGITTFVDFVWMLLWWGIVGVTFWGAVLIVQWADRMWLWMAGTPPGTLIARNMVEKSAAAMWPVLTLSLLNLLMLPAGAVNQPQSPTGLETAAALSWGAWSEYLFRSLPVMAGFAWFFVTLFVLARCIPERAQGCLSMALFVGAVVASLSVMGGWIYWTKDLFEWLPGRIGFVGSASVFFTGVTLLVCLPMHLWQRR